ncbi:unnamed protein product [Ilex paraguariensis]|uniref:Regulator of Vps4 activity in the MVB pathway protein n=2 Tax=Ilex paraguariensis TaxID=185542 RepID=A0ABC8S695_9AQUA
MLDGLLGRNFCSKCKSLIKPTRTRIEALRRRAEAKQRILKEDLAKLLYNGLDINAYGRAEEFLAGLSLLSCYDYIDHSCEYIVKQLSSMQKQSECPEEFREVVASLMFAAARFSDLPELRDLRDLFQERYGNSFEYFANQKFVERIAMKPPTMEKKLKLLQDIAAEFLIKWDSRDFEKRMAAPPALAQDQPKKYGSFHVTEDRNKLPKADKKDVSSKENSKLPDNGHGLCTGTEGNVLRRDELDLQLFGRREFPSNGHNLVSSKGGTILKGDINNLSHRGRHEFTADKQGPLNEKDVRAIKSVRSSNTSHGKKLKSINSGYLPHSDRVNIVSKAESQDHFSHGKSEVGGICVGQSVRSDDGDASYASNDYASHQNVVNLTRKLQEEEADKSKSYYSGALPPPYVKSKDNVIPPPYIKPKNGKHESGRVSKNAGSEGDGFSMDTSPHDRGKAVDSSDRKVDHSGQEWQGRRPARVKSHGHEKDHHYQDDIPLPKPRSIRRKHSKFSSGHDDACSYEDGGFPKRSSSSRRREHSRKDLQILFNDEHYQKDDEERMIDKLLLHYSKKPSTYGEGKLRKRSQAHPSHKIAPDAGDDYYNQSRDGHAVKSEMVPTPTRSVSLPREQTVPSEATKVFTRVSSFHPITRHDMCIPSYQIMMIWLPVLQP